MSCRENTSLILTWASMVGGVIVLVFACTYLFTAVNIASSEATNATAFYCFIKDHLPNDSRIINRIPKVRPRYCKNWIYEIVSAVLGMSFGLTQAITAACLIGVCGVKDHWLLWVIMHVIIGAVILTSAACVFDVYADYTNNNALGDWRRELHYTVEGGKGNSNTKSTNNTNSTNTGNSTTRKITLPPGYTLPPGVTLPPGATIPPGVTWPPNGALPNWLWDLINKDLPKPSKEGFYHNGFPDNVDDGNNLVLTFAIAALIDAACCVGASAFVLLARFLCE